MSDRISARRVQGMKARGEKVVCVTAYDALFGAIADEAGVDVILVGDSVGNTLLGFPTTLPVSLEAIEHHTRATRMGVERALLVADLPFGSYQSSVSQAVDSAVRLVKAGADAVKLEGTYTDEIAAIVRAGIPVMGHLGFTPQSVNAFGGFRVQGRGEAGDAILAEAEAVTAAGVFAIVLELIPASLSERITAAIPVPTIGIGGGVQCDGQIQVLYDVLGLSKGRFKHAKRYLEGWDTARDALSQYASEVRSSAFPTDDQSF